MTALYIILGIIAFFVLVLSIKLKVVFEYSEQVNLSVKWLFLNIKLLPLSAKAKQRREQEQTAKDAEQAAAQAVQEQASQPEQASQAPQAAKKPSMLRDLWNVHGYDGLVKMLKDTVAALNRFTGGMLGSIVIEKLFFDMRVSSDDAAQTAVDYGKQCALLYPLFGSVVTRLKVKEYDVNIYPDYLAGKNQTYLTCVAAVSPLYAVNATIALAFKLLVKVVLKVLFKKPKGVEKDKNSGKGGAS